MSNVLDSDQDRHSVGPDLGPKCLQRFTADDKSTVSLYLDSQYHVQPGPTEDALPCTETVR